MGHYSVLNVSLMHWIVIIYVELVIEHYAKCLILVIWNVEDVLPIQLYKVKVQYVIKLLIIAYIMMMPTLQNVYNANKVIYIKRKIILVYFVIV
jgi:type IV secretory pathway protease TraF